MSIYISATTPLLEKEKPEMKDLEERVVTRFATQWRQLGYLLNIDQILIAKSVAAGC